MADTDQFSDQEILARTMWGEARNQGELGMQAVACVVLNRINHPTWWGTNVRSVCLKPFQFSCWNLSDPNRSKLMEVTDADPQYKLALEISGNAISGDLFDCTNGADSYRVIGCYARWSENLQPVAIIGKHEFFRTL